MLKQYTPQRKLSGSPIGKRVGSNCHLIELLLLVLSYQRGRVAFFAIDKSRAIDKMLSVGTIQLR